MAIDKNSKAYQSLLNSWYSDQQISDMYNKASSWQSRQEVVKDTTPINPAKSQATASNVDRSWDQWNGNYVYNSSTWYYEKEWTARATQTTPEVKQETPVKQQETVGSTVPEIKQEWVLKPLSQDYYNQTWDDAQNKIRYNLNQYRQSNPWLFSTYEDFKKNFSYDARNDEQKQTLDAWYGEYQKWMEYWAMPIADLYTQYKDWSISTSDLEILKTYNPEKYAELQAQINKWNIIQAYDDTAPAEKQDFQDLAYQYASELFKRFMSWDGGSEASKFFDEYKANMDSPEMMELQDKQTDLVEQGKNIQDQIASISKDVEKEYEWTWATKSKINAIIADRTYDLQQQLRTINNEYEKYATQYNNRATQYQNEFQLQLQEYQVNMQARNQQMQELWFAMDLMNFETNEQKAQREWDYWVKQQEYANGNINSKDYTTRHKAALKSVENLLAQYPGIPTQRSAEQMADDILKAIDNWSNLWAELTKINKFMQEKPEYKYMYNNTFGGSQWFGQTVSIWWTDYVEYNGKLYTADEFNKQFWNAKWKANYTVVSPDVLKTYSDGRAWTFGSFMANSKYDDGNYIWQCGKFVNDYLQSIWAGRPFGSETIDVRKWWVNSDEWKVGTVAVFDYNHYTDWKNYWHVWIVISAPDKNGDFWVKDANFGSDGKIQTRKVNLKDVSLKWFIDPSLDQNWNRVSAGTSATLTSNNSNTNSNTVIAWWLTQAWIEQEAKNMIDWKKTYSEIKAAYGDEGLNQIELKMLDLANQWYTPDTKITDPTRLQTAENNALKQYQSMTEDAQQVLDFVDQMETAWSLIDSNKSAAEQLLITTYNKITDPRSIVRESEFNRTAEWQSLMNELRWKLGKLSKWWAWITKSELSKYINVARELGKNAEAKVEKEAGRMKIVIDKYWYSPEYVLWYDMADKLYKYPETSWGSNIPSQWTTVWNTTLTDWWKVSGSWNDFN